MPDSDVIYCERCGAVVHAGERFVDVHHCAGCELFLCLGCWGESGPRCASCEATPISSLSMRERIGWARMLWRRLEAFVPEVAGTVERGSKPAAFDSIDMRLAAIRIESTATLGRALVRGSRSAEARRLRDDIEFDRLRAIGAISSATRPAREPMMARLTGGYTLDLRSLLEAWRPSRTAAALAIAGAITGLAVAGALLGDRDPVPTGATSAEATPTPEGAVAGGRTRTPTPAPSAPGTVGGGGIPLTFDELIMGRPLPRELQRLVQGGAAEVAPIPNSVDRSLRLVASGGAPGALCQGLPETSVTQRVAVDVSVPSPGGQRLVLRSPMDGDSAELGVEVDEAGTLVAIPEGIELGSMAAGDWIAVAIELDPVSRIYEITTSSGPEDATTSHLAALPDGFGATGSEFCISSSDAVGGDIYLDNLQTN